MHNHKLDIKTNYTKAPNVVMWSSELSAVAKVLLVIIEGKPLGWSFSAEKLKSEMKEGISSIKNALRELETEGLLTRDKHSKGRGKFEYTYTLKMNLKYFSDNIINGENSTNVNPNNGSSASGVKTTANQSVTQKDRKEDEIIKGWIYTSDKSTELNKTISNNNIYSHPLIKSLKEKGLLESIEERYNRFNEYAKEHYPTLLKMDDPLNIYQFVRLFSTYDDRYIMDMLNSMENYKPLKKNNKSVFRTFNNWSKRNIDRHVLNLIPPKPEFYSTNNEYLKAVEEYRKIKGL